MLVLRAELVADVGGNAGLDAARPERDQGQPHGQAEARVVEGEGHAAETVNEREPEDRAVFPKKCVGEDRPKNREEII